MNTGALRRLWSRLSAFSLGRRIFSRLIGFAVPYAATIGARIETLAPGEAKVALADRRAVRNHLGSIHAMALGNLAELTANAVVLFSLPQHMRMIVTDFTIRFHRKARGRMTATCRAPFLIDPAPGDHVLEVEIHDARGTLVAAARQTCRVGLVRSEAEMAAGTG